jgi:methylenetetrahydrofolate reductase (NADPH)
MSGLRLRLLMSLSDDDSLGNVLRHLLAPASIEVTSRHPQAAESLCRYFAGGIDVHVTFLPGDAHHTIEDTCIRLRQAGFNPIPHLTARNFADRRTLDGHLARLAEGAQVSRVLVIAGDVERPSGEFFSSLDVMRTGLLEKHGIDSVLLAGYPEGHAAITEDVLDAALTEKIACARKQSLQAEIVTQFCFEAEPILNWLARIRTLGVGVPVRIGVAGPAGTVTLLKFGMRCGIGHSLRALRRWGTQVGKLMEDTNPDELLSTLAAGLCSRDLGAVAGIHLYTFGGVCKTSEWLAAARRRAASDTRGAAEAQLR